MPKFSPQQSLVQFSTGLWSAGTAVSSTQAQPGGCLKSVQLLGPHGCYRENAWVNGVTTYWGGALSFLGSGYVMSDLGRTRRFFKLTKQLPKLSRASVVSSPYPVHFLDLLGFLSQSSPFPRLDWPASTVASWVLLSCTQQRQFPCCYFHCWGLGPEGEGWPGEWEKLYIVLDLASQPIRLNNVCLPSSFINS